MWWGIYISLCYKFPTESNSERILKIGKYLVKLWARVRRLVFFDSKCSILIPFVKLKSVPRYLFLTYRTTLIPGFPKKQIT